MTSVRWATSGGLGDEFLISTGGGDNCVFQWACDPGDGARGLADQSGLAAGPAGPPLHTGKDGHGQGDALAGLHDAPSGGDEFTAVKVPQGKAAVAPVKVFYTSMNIVM